MTLNLCLAGEGAFGRKHLEALKAIPGVAVVSLAGGIAETTRVLAAQYAIPHWTTELGESLSRTEVEAVILATPTPLHAAQGLASLQAGKHVMIEIPIAENLRDAEELARVAEETGLVAMGGHTRRFNPSHQWVHRRMRAGTLKLQHLDAQTYFFRRSNVNALGQTRNWTDHLLWHHAAHTVDLFQYQTGEELCTAHAMQGPIHPDLKIAMDMSIQMKVRGGAICTLSLSFNNDGPLGTFFRYICDNGTYIARYDDLVDGKGNPIDLSRVDVSMNGIELQDREFLASIRQGRAPNASIARLLPAMRVLDRLERELAQAVP